MLLRLTAVGVAGPVVRRVRRRLRAVAAPTTRRPSAIAELRLVAATLMRLRAGRADPAAMPEAAAPPGYWRGDPDRPAVDAPSEPAECWVVGRAAAQHVGWRRTRT